MWPTYTLISHSQVKITQFCPNQAREQGHRCVKHATLALIGITLPPAKKTTCALWVAQPLHRQACCDYHWSGTKWEMMWGSGKSEPILPLLFRSRVSSCSSHNEANWLSTTSSVTALFVAEPASVGWFWWLLGLQPVCSVCTRHILDTFRVTEGMLGLQT